MTIAALFLAGSLSLLSAPRAAAATPQESEQYALFVDSAADLDKAEQIAMWEAFLLKYPRSPYAANARATIAELKGERPAPAPAKALPAPAPKPAPAKVASAKPAAAPADYDPDLAFLYEDAPAKAPAPKAVATPEAAPAPAPEVFTTPEPAPTPVAKPRAAATPEPSFFAPEPTPEPRRAPPAAAAASVWDAPAESPSSSASMWDEPAPSPRQEKKRKKAESRELAMASANPPRSSAARPRPPRPATQGAWLDTEVAVFRSLSYVDASAPGAEQYVQSAFTGVEVSRRLGSRLSLEVEGAAAESVETAELRTLRAQGRQPRVITKFNFAVGGGAQLGVLAPGGRNDLFVLGGGGIVNSDVEACKKGDAQCETSLKFDGVNFTYAMAGVGHRFYATSRIAFHTELRTRIVFEKVDGATNPRNALQLNVGPSFSF